MIEPETIGQLLDAMESYVKEGREVNSSDLPHSAKLARLSEIQLKYGF